MQSIEQIRWPGWNVVRLIGRGSFGAVYEIERDLFGKKEKAALKHIGIPQNPSDIEEMYSDGYDEESITASFQSHLESIVAEYSLMRKLNGAANVVNCDDVKYVQREDGIGWDIYIKMELLTPLTQALPNPIPEEVVIKLAEDMCQALVLCKRFNIVHRDIKPMNIFVSPLGDYKLGDFGIAKTVEKTMGGTKTGTYKYMAPEVYNNQPYGQQADIYSLGLVLYWMLNKKRMPFLPLPPAKLTAGMDEQAMNRRLSGELLPPPAHGSKQLQSIVLKACAYDPKDRFANAAEMLEALKALKNVDASPAAVPMGAAAAIAGGAAADVTADEMTTGTVGTVGRRRPNIAEEATIGAFGAGAAYVSRQQGQSSTHQNVGQQNGGPCRMQPAQQGSRQYAGASALPPQNKTEEKKKKRGIAAWIAIAAGLVVVIGGVLLLTLGKKDNGNQRDAGSALNNHTSESTTTSPTEPGETLPVQLDWAEWTDELPAYVTDENYTIEERTLYRSRNLETTSSTTSDKMDGWELYETVSNGQWSQWSDWSDTQYTESDTRHVEAKKFYRYHDKQTTTSTSSSKSGWTLEGSTDEYGDYGSWSEWSKTEPSADSNRKIETRYRYRTKVTSESNMPPDDGWEVEWVEDYTEPWSEWSDDYPSGTMTGKEVDERQVETGKRYYFAHYCTGNVPGAEWKTSPYSQSSDMPAFDANCVYHSLGWFDSLSAFEYRHTIGSYDGYIYYPNGSRHECSNSCWTWYLMETETTYKTQYCWRWHYDIYHIYKWGDWSSWSSDAPAEQSDREIEVQYRYCDREKTTVYSFYRWTDWSNWSEESEKETETHKGESKTFYHYQDRVEEPVYYFHRWTDWSDYSETPVEENETTKVQTKKEYRYKSKK